MSKNDDPNKISVGKFNDDGSIEITDTFQFVSDAVIKHPDYQLLMKIANNDNLYGEFKKMLEWHFKEHEGNMNCHFCLIHAYW